MTVLKYIMASGCCKTAEILVLKREHPKDFGALVRMAEEEMAHNGVISAVNCHLRTVESTMTTEEKRAWVRMLGKDTATRTAAIRSLLHHANGDRMSVEDRVICREELDRLLGTHH